jgi:hypothetical protein
MAVSGDHGLGDEAFSAQTRFRRSLLARELELTDV